MAVEKSDKVYTARVNSMQMGKCLNFVLVLSDWLMVSELNIGFKFPKIIVLYLLAKTDAGGVY